MSDIKTGWICPMCGPVADVDVNDDAKHICGAECEYVRLLPGVVNLSRVTSAEITRLRGEVERLANANAELITTDYKMRAEAAEAAEALLRRDVKSALEMARNFLPGGTGMEANKARRLGARIDAFLIEIDKLKGEG